jgi:hypothetical protein
VRVVLGADLTNPASPTATAMIRPNGPPVSVVVPGVAIGAPVQAAVSIIRSGAPPQVTPATLNGFEDQLFLAF